jgi:hypothetical protein
MFSGPGWTKAASPVQRGGPNASTGRENMAVVLASFEHPIKLGSREERIISGYRARST